MGENLFSKNMRGLMKRLADSSSLEGVSKILWSIPQLFEKYFRKKPQKDIVGIIKVLFLLVENLRQEIKGKCDFITITQIVRKKKKIKSIRSEKLDQTNPNSFNS